MGIPVNPEKKIILTPISRSEAESAVLHFIGQHNLAATKLLVFAAVPRLFEVNLLYLLRQKFLPQLPDATIEAVKNADPIIRRLQKQYYEVNNHCADYLLSGQLGIKHKHIIRYLFSYAQEKLANKDLPMMDKYLYQKVQVRTKLLIGEKEEVEYVDEKNNLIDLSSTTVFFS